MCLHYWEDFAFIIGKILCLILGASTECIHACTVQRPKLYSNGYTVCGPQYWYESTLITHNIVMKTYKQFRYQKYTRPQAGPCTLYMYVRENWHLRIHHNGLGYVLLLILITELSQVLLPQEFKVHQGTVQVRPLDELERLEKDWSQGSLEGLALPEPPWLEGRGGREDKVTKNAWFKGIYCRYE